MASKKEFRPTNAQVQEYNMLSQLLDSIYVEMKELSKKKPDETLNPFKVNTANRILEKIKVILNREPTIEFIDILDNESLPSNSDAIIVLGQFKASMEQFKSRYLVYLGYNEGYKWNTVENPID